MHSGTVSIEPSGWGTKVVLTASIEGEEPVPSPSRSRSRSASPEPEPAAVEPDPVRKRRWLRRLFRWEAARRPARLGHRRGRGAPAPRAGAGA